MNDPLIRALILTQLAATLFMTGVIWFVQVVHYPLFAHIDRAAFADYEQRHTTLTTWVVGPPMLVEAATAVLLVWFLPSGPARWEVWAGLALLVLIWLSTALVQVPCHETLSRGFDEVVHQRLVWTNWVRTVAWSLRGLLVLWLAHDSLSGAQLF